ncbi:MAG: EFR1 family ferrodoxin [Chloroflexota bacterium]
MEIHTATVIYYSPTGTTHKVIQSVLKGMNIAAKQQINLTRPQARIEVPSRLVGDIVLIGIPVYGKGIPRILIPYFTALKGEGKPVVLLTVYGNLDEGTALPDLYRLVKKSDCIVVGAASFIGEHTLSTDEIAIAKGRPNAQDRLKAEQFGQLILKKAQNASDWHEIAVELEPPHFMSLIFNPLKKLGARNESTKRFTRTPFANMQVCNQCGICARMCPMGAIDPHTFRIDERRCFHCFSCVKRCPQNARKIVYKPKFLVTAFLKTMNTVEHAPKIYV